MATVCFKRTCPTEWGSTGPPESYGRNGACTNALSLRGIMAVVSLTPVQFRFQGCRDTKVVWLITPWFSHWKVLRCAGLMPYKVNNWFWKPGQTSRTYLRTGRQSFYVECNEKGQTPYMHMLHRSWQASVTPLINTLFVTLTRSEVSWQFAYLNKHSLCALSCPCVDDGTLKSSCYFHANELL